MSCDIFMKPIHTASFTNILYMQSSGYLYGHTKPCTVKRRQKPLSVCDSSEPNWKDFCGKRHAGNAWETKAP